MIKETFTPFKPKLVTDLSLRVRVITKISYNIRVFSKKQKV
jgi:hypothetical protein